jgi:hypothetical protein
MGETLIMHSMSHASASVLKLRKPAGHEGKCYVQREGALITASQAPLHQRINLRKVYT